MKTKTRRACAGRVGKNWNVFSLAGFVTRPQAEYQIGATESGGNVTRTGG
jgi:hypothetical protein